MEIQNDFTPRPTPEASAAPAQQAAIYTDLQVKKQPFMSGFKQFYRANKIYFWAIFAGVLIIGVLSFLAFRRTPVQPQKEADVQVEFASETPKTAAIGGDMIYYVNIINKDRQKLTNLQLELTYPDGFSYEASTPKADNLSGTAFSIKELSSGQQVPLIIKAKTTGSINSQKTISAKLHYRFANFNSEFVKENSYSVTLVSSDVAFQIQGPLNTNNAQLVQYTVTYQNNSKDEIKNARIQVDYPNGFSYASADPKPDMGSNTWNLPAVAVGGQGQIQISGTYRSANPVETQTMNATFLVLGNDGQYQTQVSSTYNTEIASLPLLVSQELQQNGEATNVVNPGDTLNFRLHYQNNNTIGANNVVITAVLDSKALDLSSITAQGGVVNNNTITWNASGVSHLESLLPNDSGDINFSVKVNSPATRDSSTKLTVASHIKIASNEFTSAFPGNDLNLKISSPSNINTSLAYVSGQIPPKVGKTTVYRISLSLKNSTNDFSDAVVTAFVPAGFVPDSFNVAEKNSASFDPTSGKLTWNLGVLPAHSGEFQSSRVLSFNVSLSPASSQVNTNPVLVKYINLQAKDMFTSQGVSVSTDDITTSDLPGNNGYSQGQVQP